MQVKKSILWIMFLQSGLYANLEHICAHSNESVVKFRANMVGQDSKQALKICYAQKTLSKNSLLFLWPIDLCDFWVSSLYGPRKHRGVTKMHTGVDMAAARGTAVIATADGVVTQASTSVPGYGSLVEIKHKQGFSSRYGHLDQILVGPHEIVKAGDLIGTVGATGRVRGCKDPSHLHFEIFLHGQHVNPLQYLYCSEVAFSEK